MNNIENIIATVVVVLFLSFLAYRISKRKNVSGGSGVGSGGGGEFGPGPKKPPAQN